MNLCWMLESQDDTRPVVKPSLCTLQGHAQVHLLPGWLQIPETPPSPVVLLTMMSSAAASTGSALIQVDKGTRGCSLSLSAFLLLSFSFPPSLVHSSGALLLTLTFSGPSLSLSHSTQQQDAAEVKGPDRLLLTESEAHFNSRKNISQQGRLQRLYQWTEGYGYKFICYSDPLPVTASFIFQHKF